MRDAKVSAHVPLRTLSKPVGGVDPDASGRLDLAESTPGVGSVRWSIPSHEHGSLSGLGPLFILREVNLPGLPSELRRHRTGGLLGASFG
jgi:hypothetical protein